jgi:hypothetical protein
MRTRLPRRGWLLALVGFWTALLCRSPVLAEDFEAVFSETSNGYVRAKLADGSFQPETYTLLKGGFLGGDIADPAIDRMSFEDIARKIAGALARQNYVPSRDHNATRLLIVVYWGTTLAPDYHDPFPDLGIAEPGEKAGPPDLIENNRLPNDEAQKDTERIQQTAKLLGYGSLSDSELQSRRYFVVLLAYDFQMKLRQGTSRLLWQTRFSIREQGNEFDKQLATMVGNAAPYFGQDSPGLTHKPVPEGHVEIGELKSLGVTPETEPGHAALAPDGAHVAYLKEEDHILQLVIVAVDGPNRSAVARISKFYPGTTPLRWADAGHVLVPQSAIKSISFNLAGKRSEPDGKSAGLPSAEDSPASAAGPSLAEIQALAEEKLPDRSVVILGADDTGHRFLLLASGSAGPTRYFVFDRTDDLLYEVGRRPSMP